MKNSVINKLMKKKVYHFPEYQVSVRVYTVDDYVIFILYIFIYI